MDGAPTASWSVSGTAGSLFDVTVNDGPEKGSRLICARNGVGLQCVVHPDRGMDIGEVLYQGFPLTWASLHGHPAPWAFGSGDGNWLDAFGGGLLSTCGLLFMGKASDENGRLLGLHGNISRQSAREVAAVTESSGGIAIDGRVSESNGFFTRLDMHRRIRIPRDQAVIEVRDTVTNVGAESCPLMLLYHMNFGYPLIDPGATEIIWPGSARALWGEESDRDFSHVLPPRDDSGETVAEVEIPEGSVEVIMHNRRWLGGVAISISFNAGELPYLFHWRMFRRGVYGIAVEPSTAGLEGRPQERSLGRVRYLAPGESQTFGVRVVVWSTRESGADG